MKVRSNVLKEVLEMVGTQTDTVMAKGTPEGWRFSAYRQDRTAMIDITLSDLKDIPMKDDLPDIPSVGMKVEDWLRALRLTSGEVEIRKKGNITITDGSYTFAMADMTVADTAVRVPDTQITTTVMLEAKELRAMLAADPRRSDAMLIHTDNKGVTLSSYDENMVGMSYSVPADRCAIIEGEGDASYSLETFTEFVRTVPSDAVVEMRFAKDMPLKVAFGGRGYDGLWLLAPRVEV